MRSFNHGWVRSSKIILTGERLTLEQYRYKCDWCRTKDGCGHSSIAGSWITASTMRSKNVFRKKLQERWTYSGTRSRKTHRNPEYPNPASAVTESVRRLLIMIETSCLKVVSKWFTVWVRLSVQIVKLESSPYTGLFAPRRDVVEFLRMGSAADPVSKRYHLGLALSFLGGPEVQNYVALHSLSLGQSWDFA